MILSALLVVSLQQGAGASFVELLCLAGALAGGQARVSTIILFALLALPP